MTEQEGLEFIQSQNGMVFSVVHGTYGEDGQLTELLEASHIPFVGSDTIAMRLSIDKESTGQVLRDNGVQTPKTFVVMSVQEIDDLVFDFPVIVKPRDEGSSMSLYKVESMDSLLGILEKELQLRSDILVQEYIQGREFSCGVIEMEGNTLALLPTEIILTKGGLFDYDAKYSVDGCQEITPADISTPRQNEIQSLVLQVHNLCNCRDISRTDVIWHPERGLFVLEINTLPGMTKTSFIPQQLKASGYTLERFLEGMIKKYQKELRH